MSLLLSTAKRLGRYAKTSCTIIGAGTVGVGAIYAFQQKKQREEEDKNSTSKSTLVLPFHRLKLVKKDQRVKLGDLLQASEPKYETITVEELIEVLQEAAQDPGIVGLKAEFGNQNSFQGGPATAEEVRTALRQFRESHRVHSEPNFEHKPVLKKKGNGAPKEMVALADSFTVAFVLLLCLLFRRV